MTMHRAVFPLVALLAGSLAAGVAQAHFLVMLPSADVVEAPGSRSVDLSIEFTHPMEGGPVMEMGPPRKFGVLVDGQHHDLTADLVPRKIDGKTAYTATARLLRPGDHVFYIEPAPYWEPAERKMIVHYTKVVVDFLGAETGWDAMVGFPVEIEPLVRPYGLWTGNTFRGVVKHNGVPVRGATVEVEYDNQDGSVHVPNDAFVTQVIKTDSQGVFSYSIPKAGWWGFAALIDGDEKMKGPDGQPADVELGGLMWVKAVDMGSD